MSVGNRFLRGLSSKSYETLSHHLERVDLKLRALLQAEGEPTRWVYFPETAVLSFMTTGIEGVKVETSMVGNEGAAGLLEACGSQIYRMDTVVQIDGLAWRAPAHVCRTMAENDTSFSLSGLKLAELLLAESRRSVYCQAVHTLQHRMARWLAESQDRSGGRSQLPLTHEFLAIMLGVQRTTITTLASEMRALGVVRYQRGKIVITDKAKLEGIACECRAYTADQRRALGFEPIAMELVQNGASAWK